MNTEEAKLAAHNLLPYMNNSNFVIISELVLFVKSTKTLWISMLLREYPQLVFKFNIQSLYFTGP